jgi:small-conductance mechanosensitive channel
MDDLFEKLVGPFTTERAADSLRAAIIVLVSATIARFAGRAVDRIVRLRGDAHRGLLIGRLVGWAILSLGLTAALDELGFKLHVLLGAAGIATVAIGLATQTTLSNLVSGFFLYGERPFSVGDSIEVEGMSGDVISVNLLSTLIRTFDNRLVRIPNELLIKTKLVNYTRFPLRRLDLTIPIGHHEAFAEIRARLLEIADKHPLCLAEPPPSAFIATFGETNTQVQLWLWARTEHLQELRATITAEIHQSLQTVKRGTQPT